MAQNIKAKLYIEGCEIPFISITVTATINHPSTCMIDVVPSEYVKRLSPRSHMLVLFQEGQTWKVLWDGEYRGWGIAKSASGISMQIMGADHTNALSFMTRAVFENFGDDITVPIKAIFHTGQEFNFQPKGSGTFAQLIQKVVNQNTDADFGLILSTLISTLWDNTPYFKEANLRNKTVPRFIALSDTNLKTILTNSIANDFLLNIVSNRFTGNVTIESVLQYFMEVAGYIRVPIIGPSAINGVPSLALFKPKNHFSTPPVFNSFFPGMYTSVSGLSVDYFTEPTRILMTTENVPMAGGYRSTYFFNDSRTGLNLNGAVGNAALIKDAISPEEIDRGILPIQMDLNYERANQAVVGAKDTTFQTLQKTYQAYAFYQFVEAKFSQRRTAINAIFHPYCIVGFPGAIFDPHQTLFGMVESVTHQLSAEGGASTSVNFTHVYPAERFDPSGLTHPPLPSWLSVNYRPEGADKAYAQLFGRNSIDDKTKHAALGGPNISSAKRNIQSYSLSSSEQYNVADIASTVYPISAGPNAKPATQILPLYSQHLGNTSDFESKYAYRNIISARDYLKYMNINAGLNTDTQEPPANLPKASLLFKCPTGYSLNANLDYNITGTDSHKYDNALALQADLNASVGKDGR